MAKTATPSTKFLTITAFLWNTATVVALISPPLAVFLLYRQYVSLIKNTERLGELISKLDTAGVTQEYIDISQDIVNYIEIQVEQIPQWLVIAVSITYLIFALSVFTVTAVVNKQVILGKSWARAVGVTLSTITVSLIVTVWLFVVQFSWIPLSAFHANNLLLFSGLIYTTGIITAFSRSGNLYIKQSRKPSKEENIGNTE